MQSSGINLDLPEVKSSKEFLRRIQIKREKIMSIDMPSKPPMVASKGQFSLSMFEVGGKSEKNTLRIIEIEPS